MIACISHECGSALVHRFAGLHPGFMAHDVEFRARVNEGIRNMSVFELACQIYQLRVQRVIGWLIRLGIDCRWLVVVE